MTAGVWNRAGVSRFSTYRKGRKSQLEALESRVMLSVLVWDEEFDGAVGSAPNPDHWTYDLGTGAPNNPGWGNNERETYTDSTANASIVADPNATDGKALAINAIQTTPNTLAFTSARLKTKDLAYWTYGHIEIRAKLPSLTGTWPAFWMMGTNLDAVGWPNNGEIDIMENKGSEPTTNHETIHGPGYSGGSGVTQATTIPNGGRVDTAYHTYAIDWSQNSITWSIDGVVAVTRTTASIPGGTQWVFNHDFFILLNLAIGGGTFTPDPNASTYTTQTMLVDYVRVYGANAAPTPPTPTYQSIKINFGDDSSAGYPTDPSYLYDYGNAFANQSNGYAYGWNATNNVNGIQTYNRNSGNSPDERYDTFSTMQTTVANGTGANYSWEIAVPNGSYNVRIVAGDPTATNSVYKINAEGVLDVSGTPSATPVSAHWIDHTVQVTVADGRLTITNASGASNNKIDFIEITAVADVTPPTVATAANADANPVVQTSTGLHVLGADNNGEAGLTYTWLIQSKPSGAADPTFTVNGTNAAKNTTANFFQNGNYTFRATITDGNNNSVTSDVALLVTFGFTGIGGAGAYHIIWNGTLFTTFIDSGMVTFANDLSTGNKTVNLNVAAAATAVLNSSQKLADITVANTGLVQLPFAASHTYLYATSLLVNPTGAIDLFNNDLILNYTGSSPAGTVEGYIANGYANGAWTGNGIRSTTAGGSAGANVLGVADNAQLPAPFNTFDTIDTSSHKQILVKYTYVCDLDLDGADTSNDAINFAAHYNAGAPGKFMFGDINYTGTYDANDAIQFAAHYDASLTPIGQATASVIASPLVVATGTPAAPLTAQVSRFSAQSVKPAKTPKPAPPKPAKVVKVVKSTAKLNITSLSLTPFVQVPKPKDPGSPNVTPFS